MCFLVLISHLYIFFNEIFILNFHPFKKVTIILMNCGNYLYILDRNHLLDTSFVNSLRSFTLAFLFTNGIL